MEIFEELIGKYNLSYGMIGIKVNWFKVKKGGIIICPDCGKILHMYPKDYAHVNRREGFVCKTCGYEGAGLFKLYKTTNKTIAVGETPNRKWSVGIRKNPKDENDKDVFMDVMLHRLWETYSRLADA